MPCIVEDINTQKTEGLVPPPPEDAEKFGIQLKNEFHGTDGPLPRSYPIWYPELHVPFLQSLSELGLQNNADPVRILTLISSCLPNIFHDVVFGGKCRQFHFLILHKPDERNPSLCDDRE